MANVLSRLNTINDSNFNLAITLTDVATSGKFVYYWLKDKKVNVPSDTFSKYIGLNNKEELIESLIGSSSIPIAFPPNKYGYFDGGILNNNPLSVAEQLGEKVIFVLVPSVSKDKRLINNDIIKRTGLLNIVNDLIDTWLITNLREVSYAIIEKNKIAKLRGRPECKVCIIRPTNDFLELNIGLLDFGKKVDELISNGYASANDRLSKFRLDSSTTWFEGS
ncbi:hypothetical protein GCM10028810_44780 [Spirosoma litoris]